MRELWVLELPIGRFPLGQAEAEDVAEVVALLSDDELGASREDSTDLTAYDEAFALVDADPGHLLVLVRDPAGAAAATLQLSLLPGMSHGGALKLQIDAVRVATAWRGQGLGSALLDWAVTAGRGQGARIAQLTSHASRTDAHRFYQRHGWQTTHVGMRLDLTLDEDPHLDPDPD